MRRDEWAVLMQRDVALKSFKPQPYYIRSLMRKAIRLKDVCHAFRICSNQLWVLEARGVLPDRPRASKT